MLEFWNQIFASGAFIPHGHCYLWQRELVALHIASDALTALAYYSIPMTLLYFVRKRQDLPFNWMFLLFGAFIVACGTTHLMEIWTLWHPTYWLSGCIKAITASVSVFTATQLVPLVPKALALPSPAQLAAVNQELKREISARLLVEAALEEARNQLAIRVKGRTVQLALANQELKNQINTRKLSEAALQESQQRLALALEAGHLGTWEWNVVTGKIILSPQCEALFGLEPGSFEGTYESFAKLLHPDDVESMKRSVPEAMQHSGEWEMDFRAVHPDGSLHWIVSTGKFIYNQAGQAVRMMGIARDITDRKQAEELLANYNQTLEIQVAERTTQLARANARLEQEIATRQQVELALRHSEAKLSTILDNVGASIFIKDLNSNYTYVNPQTVKLFGFPKEEIIGFDDFKCFSKELALSVIKADREVIESGKALGSYNVGVVKKTGKLHHYLAVKVPLKNPDGSIYAICGISTDITDLKRTEEALRQSEARYLAILEEQTDLIVRCLPDGTVTFANEAYCRFFGFARSEIIGHHYQPVVFEEDREYVAELLNKLNADNPVVTVENRAIAKGEVRWTQWINRAIFDDKDKIVQVQSVGRDISDRKQAEFALQKALAAAEAASIAKSRFLSHMSHELRTPLNAILGFSQMLARSNSLNSDQKEQLQIINRSGEHLLNIINDILSISKIEAGQVILNEHHFDLYQLLNDLEQMLHSAAANKGLQLIFDRAPDIPQYLKTDESKLRQVLINLLGNAIKFTESGIVTLRVGMGQTPHPTLHTLHFEVEDTGSGIAPEEIELLFEAFQQTETGRKYQQGTGLGLAISRKYVQLMGGDIRASSKVGKGTLFAFDIKISEPEFTAIQTTQKQRQVIGLAPNQPEYCILVVDDIRESRLLLVKLFAEIGFKVLEAENGREAVIAWENWQPNLILMDMLMPVMDGYSATKQIRAREQARVVEWERGRNPENQFPIAKTVIIAFTASAFEEQRQVILAAGCDDFASKPFSEDAMLEKISQHLGVQYVYEEKSIIAPTRHAALSVISTADLLNMFAQMPTEWVTRVREAATQCSQRLILQLLEEIGLEYTQHSKALKDLANNFQFDRIMELSQQVKA